MLEAEEHGAAGDEAARLFSSFLCRRPPPPPNDGAASSDAPPPPRADHTERECLGHRGAIYGLSLSPDGGRLATASGDSTVRIWDAESGAAEAALGAPRGHEVLRVCWLDGSSVVSGGADGVARLWRRGPGEGGPWAAAATVDHAFGRRDAGGADGAGGQPAADVPQIYALQSLPDGPDGTRRLLSAADDLVHVWDVRVPEGEEGDGSDGGGWRFSLAASARIAADDATSGGAVFGGEVRNPSATVYVFDACHSRCSGLLAVAASDGSCRVLDLDLGGDGPSFREMGALRLPPDYFAGRGGHVTSCAWDAGGTCLAACTAGGRVLLWDVDPDERDAGGGPSADGTGPPRRMRPRCRAIMEGGHVPGRPLFGSAFVGSHLLLTWGGDGRVCLWASSRESRAYGVVTSPLAVLADRPHYPVYALGLAEGGRGGAGGGGSSLLLRIVMGGGDGEESFIGTPVYLYKIEEVGSSTMAE